MTKLNLAELDRLEREMQGKVMSTNVGKIHEQLRPLLDLVDRLGIALEDLLRASVPDYEKDSEIECELSGMYEPMFNARDAIYDYQRAKENK